MTPEEIGKLYETYRIDLENENDISEDEDYQVGGEHYKNKRIQPLHYIMANQMGYPEGNVVKYVTRWREKGGIQDLEKAIDYLVKLKKDAEDHPERYGLNEGE